MPPPRAPSVGRLMPASGRVAIVAEGVEEGLGRKLGVVGVGDCPGVVGVGVRAEVGVGVGDTVGVRVGVRDTEGSAAIANEMLQLPAPNHSLEAAGLLSGAVGAIGAS